MVLQFKLRILEGSVGTKMSVSTGVGHLLRETGGLWKDAYSRHQPTVGSPSAASVPQEQDRVSPGSEALRR